MRKIGNKKIVKRQRRTVAVERVLVVQRFGAVLTGYGQTRSIWNGGRSSWILFIFFFPLLLFFTSSFLLFILKTTTDTEMVFKLIRFKYVVNSNAQSIHGLSFTHTSRKYILVPPKHPGFNIPPKIPSMQFVGSSKADCERLQYFWGQRLSPRVPQASPSPSCSFYYGSNWMSVWFLVHLYPHCRCAECPDPPLKYW